MKIFLDDVRQEPLGWVRTYTAQETIQLLKNPHNNIDEISLDHDLGDDEQYGTGMTVVKWIEEETFSNSDFIPPVIRIHSANPVGIKNMKDGIESIKRMVEARNQ